MNIAISLAQPTDSEDILSLQKIAYQSEALLYRDDKIPALQQTLESLHAQFTDTLFLKS